MSVTKKRIALAALTVSVALLAGCSMRSLIGGQGAAARDLPAQRDFKVTGNPIVDQNYNFTSDPAATVVTDPATGAETLVLVTSCDELNNSGANFKMNKTYLYTTTDEYLHGSVANPGTWSGPKAPVLTEGTLPWMKAPFPDRLYAPDIQFVAGENDNPNRLMIYVPDYVAQKNNGSNDPNGKRRIGMAWSTSDSASLYNDFIPMKEPFLINPGDKAVPNGGFAYDPGIVKAEGTGEYYMAYCNTDAETYYAGAASGTLGMVKVNKDTMNDGTYLGPITFNAPEKFKDWNNRNLNAMYEEGPDVNLMTLPNGTKMYYLIFAARVAEGEDEYIGYATKSVSDFEKEGGQAGNWDFQGWVFKDLGDYNRKGENGWTNHADFVQYRNRTYVFFHKILPGNNERSACVKEIELKNDGKIVGVEPNNYDALDFMGSSMGKGFFYIRDDQPTNGKLTRIHISYMTNKGDKPATNFTLRYYLDVENGETLMVDNVSVYNSSVTFKGKNLEHIHGRTWSVNLSFDGTLNQGQSIGDIAFDLHYWSGDNFTKSNDFSQPYYAKKNAYNLWSDRMGLFNGANQDDLVCGTVPYVAISDTFNDPRIIRIDDPVTSGNIINLTCATQSANEGIKGQNTNTGWTSQEWRFEPATDISSDSNVVRIKNSWSNYYMTLNNKIQGSGQGSYYFILSQAKNPLWNSQIWIIEPVWNKPPAQGGTIVPDRYTLRCKMQPQDGSLKYQDIYLTLNNNWDNKDGGFYPVYGQARGVDSGSGNYWNTQHWMIQENYYTVHQR